MMTHSLEQTLNIYSSVRRTGKFLINAHHSDSTIYSDATTEEDMRYMIQPAQVHVGDSVNVFRHGMYSY